MSNSRKMDRLSGRRALILAVLGCLLAWAGVTAGTNSFAVLSFMSELDRVESSSLWPGFDPDAVPAAVFDGAKTYLFDHPRPPDAFRPLEGAGRVSVYEGQYGGVNDNDRLRIGETWVATCLARPSRGAGSDKAFSAGELAEIILEEKFQIFLARRHPDWQPDPTLLLTYPRDTDRSLTLRRCEMEAFRRAVEAEADEVAASWAVEGLKVRSQRLGLLDENMARYERNLERFEGLADFLRCAGRRRPIALLPESGPDHLSEVGVPECGSRVGCMIAYLLERFSPDWKGRMEAGAFEYLETELESALRSFPPKRTFSIADLVEIRQKAEDDILRQDAERTELFQRFLARPGYRVEIIAGDEPLKPVSFDEAGLVRMSDSESFHRGPLTLKSSTANLEIRTEALTVHRGSPAVSRLLLTGFAAKPSVLRGRSGTKEIVVVKSQGLTLVCRNVKVFEKGTALTIILLKESGESIGRP